MRRALAFGVLAALLAASSAEARPAFHRIGEGQVWSDGERYAAVGGAAYTGKPALVLDDATGRRWTLTPPRNECGFYAVAAREVLWNCHGLQDIPLFQNLDTGTVREVPGWYLYIRWFESLGPRNDPDRPYVTGFGDRWLRTTDQCYHCGPEVHYVDWHSGAFRTDFPDVARRSVDLDRPELDRPICAPLSRRPEADSDYGGPRFASEDYEPPWMLRDTTVSSWRLRLYHCGRRKPVTIARCQLGHCLSPQLGGGYLTWRDGYRVYASRLASRRRVRVGTLPGGTEAPTVVHTRRSVYAAGTDLNAYAAPLKR
jgi:hypothetical protein